MKNTKNYLESILVTRRRLLCLPWLKKLITLKRANKMVTYQNMVNLMAIKIKRKKMHAQRNAVVRRKKVMTGKKGNVKRILRMVTHARKVAAKKRRRVKSTWRFMKERKTVAKRNVATRRRKQKQKRRRVIARISAARIRTRNSMIRRL